MVRGTLSQTDPIMENDNDTGVLIFVAIVVLLTVLGGLYLAFDDGAEASNTQIEAVAQ